MVVHQIGGLGILYLSSLLLVRGQSIPNCFTEAATEKRLTCNSVDLSQLDATVYSRISGLEKGNILTVQLTNCTIRNLDFLDSDYLTKVGDVFLDKLTGLASSHLSSLVNYIGLSAKYLRISNNPSLTSVDALIPQSSGSRWREVETFRVPNNAIGSVNPALFRAINAAKEYNLKNNVLNTLDLTQHNSVRNVKKLLLGGNRLSRISNLQEFTELTELDLSDNQLTGVDDFIASVLNSPKLEIVNLKNNYIEVFNPEGSMDEQASSLAIDLTGNKLTTIPPLTANRAKNVRSLKLKDNSNLQLAEDTLSGLKNLEELDLSGCGISQITTHLQNLKSLRLLHLQNNHLNELSNETFTKTYLVEEIELQNNQLASLGFMVSSSRILDKLTKLDVSQNLLSDLQNFVSAPQLEELRMDGGSNSNQFGQLSTCHSFTQLPGKLKIVCARNIRAETVDGCRYRSFLDLLKAQQVIYNNDDCCDSSSCDPNSVSYYPLAKDCPSHDDLCALVPVPPSDTTTTKPNEGSTNAIGETRVRAEFHDLYDSEMIVMAVGYILAFLLLVMLMIMCLRRYRSYDKWLETHQQRDLERSAATQPLQTLRRSTETLDSIDGRAGSPKVGGNGTLQRQKGYGQKSFDNMSMASGYSQYSATNGKSPFLGRKKFKDACSIEMDETPQDSRYMSPSQNATPRLNSGEESPTAMSVYSYASHQPERRAPSVSNSPPSEKRRHRSGGAVQRLNSGDLLDLIDEDIIPPKIQVVLQRKATERRSHGDTSNPIVRNARPYGTTPYRTKAKSSGMVKKKIHSPLLTVNKGGRRSGPRTPTVVKRALPDIPLTSQGSVSSSLKSASSIASNTSKLSHSSMLKNNAVFMDGEMDESEYHETNIIGLG